MKSAWTSSDLNVDWLKRASVWSCRLVDLRALTPKMFFFLREVISVRALNVKFMKRVYWIFNNVFRFVFKLANEVRTAQLAWITCTPCTMLMFKNDYFVFVIYNFKIMYRGVPFIMTHTYSYLLSPVVINLRNENMLNGLVSFRRRRRDQFVSWIHSFWHNLLKAYDSFCQMNPTNLCM